MPPTVPCVRNAFCHRRWGVSRRADSRGYAFSCLIWVVTPAYASCSGQWCAHYWRKTGAGNSRDGYSLGSGCPLDPQRDLTAVTSSAFAGAETTSRAVSRELFPRTGKGCPVFCRRVSLPDMLYPGTSNEYRRDRPTMAGVKESGLWYRS